MVPISRPPIRDGWVAVERGCIVAAGGPGDEPPDASRLPASLRPPAWFHGSDFAVLPGLVNAHTHLELSYQHGRVPAAERFADWIRGVMAARRQHPDPAAPEILDAAREAIERARASGTVAVGDISNTLVTVPLLRDAGMTARVFYELLGFNAPDPEARVLEARARADTESDAGVRIDLAPHAPYSVSPPLFRALRADLDAHPAARSSVHLAESRDEVEFVRAATGDIRRTLEELGVWTDDWRAVLPSQGSPVGYLEKLGFLDGRVLAVHGVQMDDGDLACLREHDMTLVTCPRSNVHVGAGSPPLERFYASGVRVAIGTDSLASVGDLDMFAELAEMRRLAPDVPARELLRSATHAGAEALGFGDDLGTIDHGKRAELIAVALPPDITDVEQYLVSGRVSEVRWLTPW